MATTSEKEWNDEVRDTLKVSEAQLKAMRDWHNSPGEITFGTSSKEIERREFTKAAMQGLCSNASYLDKMVKQVDNWRKEIAYEARLLADATIAELNRKP